MIILAENGWHELMAFFCVLYKNASGKKEKVAIIPKNVSNIQIFDANIQMGK